MLEECEFLMIFISQWHEKKYEKIQHVSQNTPAVGYWIPLSNTLGYQLLLECLLLAYKVHQQLKKKILFQAMLPSEGWPKSMKARKFNINNSAQV